jgi:hypothetical protein
MLSPLLLIWGAYGGLGVVVHLFFQAMNFLFHYFIYLS